MQIEITQKEINFAERYALRWCISRGAYCDDEIKAAAREGLGFAAVFFDPAINPRFKPFAKVHIKKAIVQYYRDNFGRGSPEKYFIPYDEKSFSKNGLEDRVIAKDMFCNFATIRIHGNVTDYLKRLSED
jgi:DNA-directed RNA polymerase specialized sigma subunit